MHHCICIKLLIFEIFEQTDRFVYKEKKTKVKNKQSFLFKKTFKTGKKKADEEEEVEKEEYALEAVRGSF